MHRYLSPLRVDSRRKATQFFQTGCSNRRSASWTSVNEPLRNEQKKQQQQQQQNKRYLAADVTADVLDAATAFVATLCDVVEQR
jgi:hypothetical protein